MTWILMFTLKILEYVSGKRKTRVSSLELKLFCDAWISIKGTLMGDFEDEINGFIFDFVVGFRVFHHIIAVLL